MEREPGFYIQNRIDHAAVDRNPAQHDMDIRYRGSGAVALEGDVVPVASADLHGQERNDTDAENLVTLRESVELDAHDAEGDRDGETDERRERGDGLGEPVGLECELPSVSKAHHTERENDHECKSEKQGVQDHQGVV